MRREKGLKDGIVEQKAKQNLKIWKILSLSVLQKNENTKDVARQPFDKISMNQPFQEKPGIIL